ncbi:ABC transporter permease [Oleomonas cavernae]|uniref:ABC transporter permease n=1 Tax=Oleomonas cavernae TaxID=2320859 RepID=A0A418WGK6_9PROT|nr:ABC transporter permease [Oleomonas cavernae]RJF89155.1 ABC transporter permease [Oleomonas cavernae]
MTALWQAFRAEFRRLRGNPIAMAAMVGAVVLYGVFYPQPYLNEAIKNVPVIVVDQDNSASSRELIRRIDAGEGAVVAATANDLPAAREAFFARRVYAIVVVPPYFERDLLAGRQSPIAAFGDGGYFLIYRQAMAAVSGAAQSLGVQVETRRLVAAGTDPAAARALVDPMPTTLVPLFNPQGGYASYIVPAAFVMLLQQTLLMGIGALRGGTRGPAPPEDAAAGPVGGVFGPALCYVTIFTVWMMLYLVLLAYVYHLPRLGALGDMLGLGLPFLLATSFLGLTLAYLMPSRESVVLLLVGLGMPLLFISGISWPTEAIPAGLEMIGRLIPSSSAIPALVRVNQMGATLAQVRHEWLTLLALALLYGTTAVLAHRWRTGRIRSTIRPVAGTP